MENTNCPKLSDDELKSYEEDYLLMTRRNKLWQARENQLRHRMQEAAREKEEQINKAD